MARWNVLIYDGNEGQLRAGLGPWEQVREWKQQSLLQQDPEAATKVRSLDDFFQGLDVEYREVSTYEQCAELIGETDILVMCKGLLDDALIAQASKLREVHVLGAQETALIDDQALRERGITITYTPMTNFIAVAEHTVALILALVKRLSEADQRARNGTDWMIIPGNVPLLRDLTVGILGVGEIGYETIRLLKPWGMKLLYHDLFPHSRLEEDTRAQYVEWRELFEQSDVVSVHLPLNEHTTRIIGKQEFGWMKRTSLLINTARGEIVDQAALIDTLKTGQIGGAGLDVFAEEPLPTDSELHGIPNVILTPHIGWAGPWTLVNDAHRVLSGVADAVRKLVVAEDL